MLVIAKLPDLKYFQSIPGTESWPYQWQAIATTYLRVVSKTSNPWEKEQYIAIDLQKNQAKTSTVGIILKCQNKELDKAPRAEFIFDEVSGVPHSVEPTLRFYALDVTAPRNKRRTIALSVVAIK